MCLLHWERVCKLRQTSVANPNPSKCMVRLLFLCYDANVCDSATCGLVMCEFVGLFCNVLTYAYSL